MVMGIIPIVVGIILIIKEIKIGKKLESMSQSDLGNIFTCPACGSITATYLIKLEKDQIIVKQKCPNHSGKLHRIPLRFIDYCISYFRDSVFLCFKCGQESTVYHVWHSGAWTLIKLSCPTHGIQMPNYKIWNSIYPEITNKAVNPQ